MEYQLNLGAWNSVFAVPSAIVDRHIKLAGAAQLKVILWMLRHAGENFEVEDVAKALSMHEADVRDSMQYWIETGVIREHNNTFTPSPLEDEPVLPQETEKEETSVESAAQTETKAAIKPALGKRPLSRPEKPDYKYLCERMEQDDSVAFLMQSADEIFGRMIGNNEKAVLLMIHEYDGLPVEVVIMLLQYAVSIGKGNMRYIEKMAISWSDEEILTLEAAEKKIKKLNESRLAAKRVQRIFGQDEHSPTERETELADRWINQWHLSDEVLRAAYEACVDTKGKFIPSYIAGILDQWFHSGTRDISQIRNARKEKKKKSAAKGYEPTYDIAEYESTSVIDEEWDD